ncbi:unnamed protein product [Cylicocyclus nassatus]|uniref:Uncharacterized protein n=1 Tax=Cylicocyclus nassatus TaxID=53992 RepID=A0AA36ME32_CYLNA|nr:unnamed protein product [Cylicocyclus nassatus]
MPMPLLTAFTIYVLVFLLLTFTSSLFLCSQKRAEARGAEPLEAKKDGPLKVKKEGPDKMVQPPRVVIGEDGEVSYDYRQSKGSTETSKASRGSTSTELRRTSTTLTNTSSNLCRRRESSNSQRSCKRSAAHASSSSRDEANSANT